MTRDTTLTDILNAWAPVDSEIGLFVRQKAVECLDVYRRSPARIREDYGTEQAIAEGGYGHRQLFELVQNGADAILERRPGDPFRFGGRIEVVLTNDALYCANEGAPIDAKGVEAILFSHISNKRGAEIGHFGLGFKSVLAITKHPQFLSRSGSFAFDTERSSRLILAAADEAEEQLSPEDREHLPGLRIAEPLSPFNEARKDVVLRELMSWAATVIKLPRDGRRAAELGGDVRDFPARFLLFSPHVSSLVLKDVPAGSERIIIAQRADDGLITLSHDGETSDWRVFHCDHEPSDTAREDGGTIAGRQTVPIDWAVPITQSRRQVRGQFWAFFPTTYETTLSGILNAPWKTNADRQGLLQGPYNRELLQRTAELVAASLPSLLDDEDPGVIVDRLPARDTLQWADEALGEAVYQALASIECLPDSSHVLCRPSDLTLLPAEADAAMQVWQSFSPSPPGWAHHSVGSRERRPRAQRLGARDTNLVGWLESVAGEATPEASIRALHLVGALHPDGVIPHNSPIRQAPIILASSGECEAPSNDALLLNTEFASGNPDLLLVDPRVEQDPAAMMVLSAFRLKGASPLDELKRLTPPEEVGETWDRFWTVLRWVDFEDPEAGEFVRANRYKIKIRTTAGKWRHVYEALLPGKVVFVEDLNDAHHTVDVDYHEHELATVTELLDLTDGPRRGGFSRMEPVFERYELACRRQFFDELPDNSSTPREDAIVFDAFRDKLPVGPLTPLVEGLSPAAAARFTRLLLPLASQDPEWSMGHGSPHTRNKYPVRPFPALSQVAAEQCGMVETSLGLRPASECVAAELDRWSRFLPCASDLPAFLQVPQRLEDVEETLLQTALEATLTSSDPLLVGAFYGQLASLLPRPHAIRCAFGDAVDTQPPDGVTVTHLRWLYDKFLREGNRALFTETEQESRALAVGWGLVEASTPETAEVRYADPGEAVPLSDLFPNLPQPVLGTFGSLELIPCADVWTEYSTEAGTETLDARVSIGVDNDIYYREDLDRSDLLDAIAEQTGIQLTPNERETAVEITSPRDIRTLRATIATEPSPEGKLALALTSGQLRAAIPVHVLGAAEQRRSPLDDRELARLILSVYGVSTLRELRPWLAAAGLQPPTRWAGSPSAIAFTRDLGFPDAFAGSHETKRTPWMDVDGPIDLNPLHPFQMTIADRIGEFLRRQRPGRGFVSLPTGAGKTRVVTESLVREFRNGTLTETILWIADRDELCEQAVQTWREVWRAKGPQDNLRISRLWGDTNSAVVATPGRPHLVVASYQSLVRRLGGGFSWILDSQAIVVDEAHGSIAPSYTNILSSFGLDAFVTERPLIGLSATPFRGRMQDDEETRRLVNRYGAHRFDNGVFEGDDPYPELRRIKVLSDVDWQELPGSPITLNANEMAQLQQFKVLPRAAEGRLGREASRNESIIRAVRACPSDWPILLFATSVDHAELLAGLLALEGISAQAISSRTRQDVRRYAIEAFRRKDIRVLTNYGVLTTGFDAPETRAIFVARPVYSPGLYQQMIGRGLRGPLNGGTDKCLIVNVADNVLAYGEQLAFRQFEHLWKMGDPAQQSLPLVP